MKLRNGRKARGCKHFHNFRFSHSASIFPFFPLLNFFNGVEVVLVVLLSLISNLIHIFSLIAIGTRDYFIEMISPGATCLIAAIAIKNGFYRACRTIPWNSAMDRSTFNKSITLEDFFAHKGSFVE